MTERGWAQSTECSANVALVTQTHYSSLQGCPRLQNSLQSSNPLLDGTSDLVVSETRVDILTRNAALPALSGQGSPNFQGKGPDREYSWLTSQETWLQLLNCHHGLKTVYTIHQQMVTAMFRETGGRPHLTSCYNLLISSLDATENSTAGGKIRTSMTLSQNVIQKTEL